MGCKSTAQSEQLCLVHKLRDTHYAIERTIFTFLLDPEVEGSGG
jgi:hypothetical protein